jgi:hypothetical protein
VISELGIDSGRVTRVIALTRVATIQTSEQRRLLVMGYHALIFICLCDNVCS